MCFVSLTSYVGRAVLIKFFPQRCLKTRRYFLHPISHASTCFYAVEMILLLAFFFSVLICLFLFSSPLFCRLFAVQHEID